MTDDPAGLYRWVLIAEVEAYSRRGWIVVRTEPTHHHRYSVLMELPGATEDDEIVEALVGEIA